MSSFWDKFDAELQSIYSNYLMINSKRAEKPGWVHPVAASGGPLSILMQFTGDIAEIETQGFKTTWNGGLGIARGDVKFTDLERIASHPNVIQLEYGTEQDILLDASVAEIRARGEPGGSRYVWSVDRTSGVFTGTTGSGVVIGIIDSGIDFRHPIFFKTDLPKTTRILRIWDQGLTPRGLEYSPGTSYLQSPFSYGVEYTDVIINAILRNIPGATPVRHKDCSGHGTHVASIAAGDGRAPTQPFPDAGYTFVGVAPKADLIIVKIFYPETDPINPQTRIPIPFQQRFEDAITYVERVAERDLSNRPVVINYSGGSSQGPHDGLSANEIWLAQNFNGKRGCACIVAAGNSGSLEARHHATITIPSLDSVEIPFKLYDRRRIQRDFYRCRFDDNTHRLFVELWYPDISPGKVSASLKVPGASMFSASLALGDPELNNTYDGNKRYILRHTSQSTRRPLDGTSVTRNRILLEIQPHGSTHRRGIYVIKLDYSGPAEFPVYAWCSQEDNHGFMLDGPPLPSGISPSVEHTIYNPAGAQNVITVASYDDITGDLGQTSSRGPLADYSGLGSHTAKPDLAAPGVAIKAGRSDDRGPLPVRDIRPPGYHEKSGTSMAAPHVAGTVALLLEKKGDLAAADIIDFLRNEARPVSPHPNNNFGWGKLDAWGSFDAVP